MSLFSEQYPPVLQGVVKHAERFCVLLGDAWVAGDDACVWLLGRHEEVELVVGCLVDDWKRGVASEEEVARSVGAYLRALHIAARGVLEVGDAFACCSDGAAITLPPVDLSAMTRFVPLSALAPVEVARAHDTVAIADPAALMAEWEAKWRPG